jgi:hypothetical protein
LAGKDNVTVLSTDVDEHYFDTMGIAPERRNRLNDDLDAPRIAIVNQQLAQHYWPNQDPLGKRFRLDETEKRWIQIVGVARNSKYLFFAEPPSDFVYFPYRQKKPQRMVMVAQSAGAPSQLAAPLREVVRGLDANQPIYNVRTMEELYRMRATSVFNVLITLVGSLGGMGLGLAIVGLYGLVAYAATRRTREIGIRMAIGADRTTVLRMVLRQGIVLALVGLLVGLVASVVAGEALRAAFASNDPRDFVAPLLVAPIVLAVAFLAAYIPAHRASARQPRAGLTIRVTAAQSHHDRRGRPERGHLLAVEGGRAERSGNGRYVN